VFVVVDESWSVHPDFWGCMPGVDYKRAYARAEWLASLLKGLASAKGAPESLRLAVGLYGVDCTARADGTAIAWVGPDPDDAELWAELSPGERLRLSLDVGLAAA
jgi:hypothetical protein